MITSIFVVVVVVLNLQQAYNLYQRRHHPAIAHANGSLSFKVAVDKPRFERNTREYLWLLDRKLVQKPIQWTEIAIESKLSLNLKGNMAVGVTHRGAHHYLMFKFMYRLQSTLG